MFKKVQQQDVSLQRGMPVEVVADAAYLVDITGETVQLQYVNAGVLTNDAGQAAGTVVIGKLARQGVLSAMKDVIGTYKNTSLSFTSTALTTEVDFPYLTAELYDLDTPGNKMNAVTEKLNNGEYCVDYRSGLVYGKKADNSTSLTNTAYSVSMAQTSSGGGPTANVNINQVAGNATESGIGAAGSGALRVTIGTNDNVSTKLTSISSAVAIPTTLTGGNKVVAVSGTAESLGAALPCQSIYIRAKATNTGNVYVGDSAVDAVTNQQIILASNDSLTINISNRSTVYVDVDVNGEGVDYLVMS